MAAGGVMVLACMAATDTGSLAFIDDAASDSSCRMNSDVYRSILSAQVQPNASKHSGQCFILQQDNDL
uniref:Uncharacterized protein n=1 Tax=Anguilla anguilla TaxID=7936 RepID=A0A0E9WPL9_ANGAN